MDSWDYAMWVLDNYTPGIQVDGRVFHTCLKCCSFILDSGDNLQKHVTWHETGLGMQIADVVRRIILERVNVDS